MSRPANWSRNRSYLVPIGGGEIPPRVIRAIIDLRGNDRPTVAIIPAASANPPRVPAALADAGVNVNLLSLSTREDADDAEIVGALEIADIVFFTGGNQLRLMQALAGSRAEEILLRRLSEGVVIAGTSAGAAVMGEYMPACGTGWGALRCGALPDSDECPPREDVSPQPMLLSRGLGLLAGVAIDQHFFARGRFGRLAFTVTRHREIGLTGLGIDESTALLIDWQTEQMVVAGRGNVAVVTASRYGHDNVGSNGPLTSFGLAVDLLGNGYGYDLRKRETFVREDARNLIAASVDDG